MSFERLAAVGVGLAAAFLPQAALAYDAAEGMEDFLIGLLQPLSRPAPLLALLALGMSLGWRRPEAVTVPWAAFAIAMVLGVALALLDQGPGNEEPLLLLVATATALLSALHPNGLFVAVAILAGAGGLLVGLLSAPDLGPLGATIITLVGSFLGANLALFYMRGAVGWLRERFTQHWVEVGLRVVAAWIAAVAMLMGALTFVG